MFAATEFSLVINISNITLYCNASVLKYHLSKVIIAPLQFDDYSLFLESPRNSFSSSWLKKAYQRAKEEAEEEGKSLADVVAKRYGVSHMQVYY